MSQLDPHMCPCCCPGAWAGVLVIYQLSQNLRAYSRVSINDEGAELTTMSVRVREPTVPALERAPAWWLTLQLHVTVRSTHVTLSMLLSCMGRGVKCAGGRYHSAGGAKRPAPLAPGRYHIAHAPGKCAGRYHFRSGAGHINFLNKICAHIAGGRSMMKARS